MKTALPWILGAALIAATACRGGGESTVSLSLTPDISHLAPGQDAATALQATVENLRQRASLYGVAEPEVSLEGETISATLRDIPAESARDLLTTVGNLEFKRERVTPEGLVVCRTLEGEEFGVPPRNVNPDDVSGSLARCFSLDKLGEPVWDPVEVVEQDGQARALTQAHVEPGSWEVRTDGRSLALRLNPEGSDILERVTAVLRGYHLGLFVDGELIGAPRIQRAITDGAPVISGFRPEQARVLAAVMNAGPLPVPLAVAE